MRAWRSFSCAGVWGVVARLVRGVDVRLRCGVVTRLVCGVVVRLVCDVVIRTVCGVGAVWLYDSCLVWLHDCCAVWIHECCTMWSQESVFSGPVRYGGHPCFVAARCGAGGQPFFVPGHGHAAVSHDVGALSCEVRLTGVSLLFDVCIALLASFPFAMGARRLYHLNSMRSVFVLRVCFLTPPCACFLTPLASRTSIVVASFLLLEDCWVPSVSLAVRCNAAVCVVTRQSSQWQE